MSEKLNLYAKLQKVRVELQKKNLKKSGVNKFSNYTYFELQDFLPEINKLCHENGLSTIFNFNEDYAYLIIVNTEDPSENETFSTPVQIATLKGAAAMQNIGATQSYARRYLYIMAFEIAENDLIDAGNVDEEAEIAKSKITPVKAVIIKKAIEETKTDMSKFLNYFNASKVEEMKEGQFAEAMAMLDKKKADITKCLNDFNESKVEIKESEAVW